MRKRALIVIGLLAVFFVLQGCSSKPEKTLLTKYFNAVRLNDNDTMSSMALEPFQPQLESWEIVSVSEEKIEPAILPELNKREIEAKKAQDAQVGPTIDADSALKDAQDEKDLARTAAAKAAAQRKIDQLQAKYDEEYKKMTELKKAYTDAKAAAAREEAITLFSLGLRELPGVRDFEGTVHSKEVVVRIKPQGGSAREYRLPMRMYQLKTEPSNLGRGRWVILRFEPVS